MDTGDVVFESIRSKQLDKLAELLNNDPKLADLYNQEGTSILLYAIYHHNDEAVTLIRSYKTKVSIFEAACLGDMETLDGQLAQDPALLDAFSPDGFTLLGYTCFFGQEALAAYLIDSGANVDLASSNDFKVAPIHSAVAISNINLTKLLIEQGANINARQQGGFTALQAAVKNGSHEIERLLRQNGAGQ